MACGSAIVHAELGINSFQVLANCCRGYSQNHADFDIRLAMLKPEQHFVFARRKLAVAPGALATFPSDEFKQKDVTVIGVRALSSDKELSFCILFFMFRFGSSVHVADDSERPKHHGAGEQRPRRKRLQNEPGAEVG
jgi:hypothetical protein